MGTENETPEVEGQENETEFSEAGLLDAVSEAMDEVTIAPDGENDANESGSENDEPNDNGDAADAAGVVSEDEPKESGNDDSGNEEESQGRSETDEEGGSESGEDTGEAGGDDPAAADDPNAGKDKGDASTDDGDPLNDPVPESLNESTQKRIHSLIDIAKERTTEAEQGQEIISAVVDAGADPDQFANTLGFLKLYNSSDEVDRKAALKAARGVVRELSLELGEGANVVDLTAHPDLVAEVEANQLTEERALEIASQRELQTLNTDRSNYTAEQRKSQEQTQANITVGKTQLNTFEQTMRAADATAYDAIRPHFIRVLGPVLRRTHPSEWGAVAKETYEAFGKFVPAPATEPKPKPKVPPEGERPLRPKGQGGGSNNKESEPKSALEAMNRGLDSV